VSTVDPEETKLWEVNANRGPAQPSSIYTHTLPAPSLHKHKRTLNFYRATISKGAHDNTRNNNSQPPATSIRRQRRPRTRV
jgi:hypothetical protein